MLSTNHFLTDDDVKKEEKKERDDVKSFKCSVIICTY